MFEEFVPLRITKKLLAEPGKKYSVRSLAGVLGVSPASVSKTLRLLEAEGMATKEVIGRSHLYRANLESALCRHYKVVFNLEKVYSSGFLQKCRKTFRNIVGITMHGSMAKGTNNERSDYDFVIVTASEENAHLDISGLGLDAEANCFVFSFGQWKKQAGENAAFYSDVLLYGIPLEGEKLVVK